MDILEAWNKENVCMILRIDFYDDIFFFLSWAHEDMDLKKWVLIAEEKCWMKKSKLSFFKMHD